MCLTVRVRIVENIEITQYYEEIKIYKIDTYFILYSKLFSLRD